MKTEMFPETNSDSNAKKCFSEAYHNEKREKKKQELLVGSEIHFDKPKIDQDKITKKKRKENAKLADVSFENFQKDSEKLNCLKISTLKNKIYPEVGTHYNEVELKQLKNKEKKAKFESIAKPYIDYDKHEIKKHKKKKKSIELGDSHFKEYQRDKHTKQKLFYSEKCSLMASKIEYDDPELKELKKKKKKLELDTEPTIDFIKHHQSDKNMKQNLPYSETSVLPTEYEKNFTHIHKRKKRNKEKHSNSSALEMFIFNEDELVYSQKEEKIQTNVNETDISGKKKKKRIFFVPATETNNSCYELNENCSSINLAEKIKENRISMDKAFAIDKTEIMPKKHKKKKKHPGIPEVHNTFEHDITSSYFLNETDSQQKTKKLNATESIIATDDPEMNKKYGKNQEGNVYDSFTFKFVTEDHNLSEKFDSEIKVNKRHSIIDGFNKYGIKHKRKKKRNKKEKNDLVDANLEINTQSANYSDSVYMFNNISDNSGVDLNSLKKRKIEEAEITKVNVKKKHKKNKKNNRSIVDKKDYIYNLEQDFIEKQSTDISGTTFSGNTHFNSNDNSRNFVYNKSNEKSNFEIIDIDDNSLSISNEKNKQIYKQKIKHLKNFALNESEFTGDNICDSNDLIIKDKGTTVNMISDTDEVNISCFDKDVENSAKIRSIPSDDRVEYRCFSPDLDCMEEPVTFEVPPLHQFETVSGLTEEQKNELKLLDIFIKKGKFTVAEDKLIQRNFDDFVKKYGISDPFLLLGLGRYKKNPELYNFLKAKHFYVTLSKDLNDRSLHSVYKRARTVLHPFRESGKLTENEISNLKKLHVSAPNKWNLIADTLGSTAERCAETYRWHEKNVSKGQFTEEEKTQLIEALKKVSNSPDISYRNIKRINWDAVATNVPSRNSSQCRMFWANNLSWVPDSAKMKWNKQCHCKLLHILKELNVENPSRIDWNKVYEAFEDYAPSPLYVQKRWLYLRSKVPNYKIMNHKEIVNILCNKYITTFKNDAKTL